MGGLNIALPQDLHKNLEKSIEISTPLASFNNDSFEIQQCELEQTKISLRQKADMQRELISKKSRIENNLPEMKYTIQLASEKGASSWLNALPLSKHGFDLTKTEFRDGIALRYTWEAKNTPAICPFGKEFSLTHALPCAKGGYTHLRHNESRDVFANQMDDVCRDVQIEPKLQSLDGEIFSSNSTTTDDDARLDIKANGLWGSRFHRTFFDVKIFNPHAKSCPKTMKDAYKCHESIKRNNTKSESAKPNAAVSTHWFLLVRGGGGCWAIGIARYETTRNKDQWTTRRAVRRHYKLHPNENQLRTSEELCSLLEGMSRPQASCSQWDFD